MALQQDQRKHKLEMRNQNEVNVKIMDGFARKH